MPIKKKLALGLAAALSAAALVLIPSVAASASTHGYGFSWGSGNIVIHDPNFYYHAGGTAYMTSMNYNDACSDGSGYSCWYVTLGLRNTGGTQVTNTGAEFNPVSGAQYFKVGSSTSVPAAYYAMNYKDNVYGTPVSYPLTASGTLNY